MFRKNTSFWVFLQVHSILNYSPELKLKSFHFQGNHNWAWKKSCRLVAIPCNSNLKSFAYEYLCRSVPRSCPTLCDPTDCSTPGLPVLYHLPEFAQTHVHWVGDAIQPSHPLSSPSPLPLPHHNPQWGWGWLHSSPHGSFGGGPHTSPHDEVDPDLTPWWS